MHAVSDLHGYPVEEFKAMLNKVGFTDEDVHPSKDNMLKVSTDGRKAALDLTLVKREQLDGNHSKVCRCVETAMDIYGR